MSGKKNEKRQKTFLLSSTIPDEIQKSLHWKKGTEVEKRGGGAQRLPVAEE